MLLQRHPSVPAAEPVDTDDRAGPVVESVTAERAVAIAAGIGEHLIRDDDGDVVSPGQRQEVRHPLCDLPE